MKTRIAVLSIVLACALPIAWAQTSVPTYVNYQGTLSDAAGQPLASGYYTMSFNIFPSATASTAAWGPQVFDGVTGTGHGSTVYVSNGVFNVALGPVDTANRSIANAFGAPDRYIEITIGTNAPIQPRQQILAAPYAMKAADGVPVGGIVPFFGNPADLPANWKICDGSVVSDPQSPLNGKALPDLRARFPRGESDRTRNLLTAGVLFGGSDNITGSTGNANPAHWHDLPELTGKISDSGPDPGLDPYHLRDDNNNWEANCRMTISTCNSGQWEGHHYHILDGTTFSTDMTHSHTMGGDNMPAYRALHYIIRIR